MYVIRIILRARFIVLVTRESGRLEIGIVLYLLPVLNPKSYDGRRESESELVILRTREREQGGLE